MDKRRYPSNADPRPKRRRDKYNPYSIYSVGAKTDEPHFYVAFADTTDEKVTTEISREIFELLNQFELEDLSYLNEIDRHFAYSDESESELHTNSLILSHSPEDMFKYDDLYDSIKKLPEKQRKRLVLYYFNNLTLEEIAKLEGVSFQTINKSINLAIKKLSQTL